MLKTKWYWTLAAFVILCVGSFIFFRPKPRLEPIKIYKVVTPGLKPSPAKTDTEIAEIAIPPGHEHGHSHNTDSHSHMVETPTNSDRYDWLDDNSFDLALSKNDPWKQTYPEGESTDETGDTYPPRDWYKTEDPALYIVYLQAQLIKQFGDIPEVHTFVDFEERRRFGISIKDADEYLSFLKAQYTLWPIEETRETLETLEKRIEAGANIVFGPMEVP